MRNLVADAAWQLLEMPGVNISQRLLKAYGRQSIIHLRDCLAKSASIREELVINGFVTYPLRQDCADAAWQLLESRPIGITQDLLARRSSESIIRLRDACVDYDKRTERLVTHFIRRVDVYPNGR